MNRVILSGEIGSDITLKKTATGQSLCNFSIEVKEKGKNGQEFKSFFDCTGTTSRKRTHKIDKF